MSAPRTHGRTQARIVRHPVGKPYWFAQPDGEQRSVFVHLDSIQGARDGLAVGAWLDFSETCDARGRGQRAVDARVIPPPQPPSTDTNEH